MGRRIDEKTKEEMLKLYLSDDSIQFKQIAEMFGVCPTYASRIIHEQLQAGNGVKPDRRQEQKSPWMEYVTPLHKHKQELEQKVQHKQAELDAAIQELRDFTATLKQLMEDTT